MKRNNRSTLYKNEQELQKEGMMQSCWFKSVALLLCLLCDFACVYTCISKYLTQSILISVLESGVIALILDGSPSIFSELLGKSRKTLGNYIFMSLLLMCFSLIFGLYFNLRIQTKADMFVVAGSLSFTSVETSTASTPAQDALAWLFALCPLCTSILCFVLFYNNEKERRIKKLRLHRIQLKEEISQYQTATSQFEQEIAGRNLTGYDNQNFENACATVEAMQKYGEIIAQTLLAKALGNNEAAEKLLCQQSDMKVLLEERMAA